MANTISWSGMENFSAATFEDLVIADAPVGQVKKYNGLTFIQVESAGHMVRYHLLVYLNDIIV